MMELSERDSSRLGNLLNEEWLLHEPALSASLKTTNQIRRKADVEILAKVGYTIWVDKVKKKIMSILEGED